MRRTRFVLVSLGSAVAIASGAVPVQSLANLTAGISSDLQDWTAGPTAAMDRAVAQVEGTASHARAATLQVATAVAHADTSPLETVRSLLDGRGAAPQVAVRGWLSAKLADDTYAFHDRTGAMNVYIDPAVLRDRVLTPGSAVELIGARSARSGAAAMTVSAVSDVSSMH